MERVGNKDSVPCRLSDASKMSGTNTDQAPGRALSFASGLPIESTAQLEPLPLGAVHVDATAGTNVAQPVERRSAFSGLASLVSNLKTNWAAAVEEGRLARLAKSEAELWLLEDYERDAQTYVANLASMADGEKRGEPADANLAETQQAIRDGLLRLRPQVIALLNRHTKSLRYEAWLSPTERGQQLQHHIERLRNFSRVDLHLPNPAAVSFRQREEEGLFLTGAVRHFCGSISNNIQEGLVSESRGVIAELAIKVKSDKGPGKDPDVLSCVRASELTMHDEGWFDPIRVHPFPASQSDSILKQYYPKMTLEGIDIAHIVGRLMPDEIERINSRAPSAVLAWSHPPGLWEAICAATERGQPGILADHVHQVIPSGGEQVHDVAFDPGLARIMGDYAAKYALPPSRE